jgi:hypothetical protein
MDAPGAKLSRLPFSMELGNTGINTRLRGVLASGVDQNFCPGLIPLRERIDNPWVSLSGLAFSYLRQSPFPNISTPVHGLGCAHSAPWGFSLPEDVTRQEARCVCSERLRARRQRRRVEGDAELACPPATDAGRSLPNTLALAGRKTLHLFQVRLKRRKRKLACAPLAPFEFPHFFPSLFLQRLSWGSSDTLASPMELTRAREVEDATTLASACEDVEGLVQKVALLEGELTKARQALEVVEEKFCSLSDTSADGVRSLVAFEMEHQEHFEELSLLRAWGAELCLAIVGPSQAGNHMSERMRAAAIRHIEMAKELATLWVAVTSAMELVLGRSPDVTFWVEIADELVAKFQKLEERCSWLERPSARIYDLLLGPPPDQARWADRPDEAVRRLEAELTARR